jgi:hypothetical protein
MVGVVAENEEAFDPKFIEIWRDVHLPISKLIERIVEKSLGDEISVAFQAIGGILADSIDTVRFELYELDYMINSGKKPFLTITDLCLPVLAYTGKNLPEDRARVYMEKLGVKNSFELKNYTDSYSLFVSCGEKLTSKGINLTNFKKEELYESTDTKSAI